MVQYLVLWKGFPLHEATWELVTNLKSALLVIKVFENTCNEDVAS